METVVDAKRFKLIDTDKLVKADWNYKEENEQLTEKLVANIKRNGQIENILVRQLDTGFFEVVNGNHRVDALKIIGATKVMCYDLGTITAQQAYRIAIETNETKFTTDTVKLAGLIAEVANGSDIEELLKTMPYNKQEMENFLGMASFDWNQFEQSKVDPEVGGEDGGKRIIFQLSDELAEAWQQWKTRCAKLSPELQLDEDVLTAALRAALDHTE